MRTCQSQCHRAVQTMLLEIQEISRRKTFDITTLCIKITTLSIEDFRHNTLHRGGGPGGRGYARHRILRLYADCHYPECRYAICLGANKIDIDKI
jgi:hypothetical protein